MKNDDVENIEVKGRIKFFLLNPLGEVDGFILEDEMQINVPPHLSLQLTSVVSINDKVDVRGFKETDKVIKASRIINLKNLKSIEVKPLKHVVTDEIINKSSEKKEPLDTISVNGEIRAQILGIHNEIIGVVLKDGSVVRFHRRMFKDQKININVGEHIKAKGSGTSNNYGHSLEATMLSN